MSFEALVKSLFGENATEDQITKLVEASNSEVDTAVSGLKANQEKNLDQIAKLKKSQIPDGFDKEGYEKYTKEKEDFDKKQKELEDKKLQDEGQWVALKDKMAIAHKNALDLMTAENETTVTNLRKALDKELIENSLAKAIDKEKGNAFFLVPHLKGSIKTVLNGEAFETHVVDGEGQQRMTDEGNPFSISDLVAEAKANEMFAPAFPDLNSGSGRGANHGSGGGSAVNPWKKETRNVTAQAKMNKENPALAAQMRKAAGIS